MYTKCGSIEVAWRVLHEMPSRNVVTRTSVILGHVQCGQWLKALELFRQMQEQGVRSNSVTFVGMLNVCASMVAIEEGRGVRQQVIECRWDSEVFVANSLVYMYGKCGSMEDAWGVFNKLRWMGMVTKLLNILNRCVKKMYSQMIAFLFVFCQLVAMQVWWMKACTAMLQWSMTVWFLQSWNITPVSSTSLTMLAIFSRQRIWSWQCPGNHMWLHGLLYLVLAEFMVMRRSRNVLAVEFFKWSLKMLLVMWRCQTSMLLLATGISVRILNIRERKKGGWIMK